MERMADVARVAVRIVEDRCRHRRESAEETAAESEGRWDGRETKPS